MKVFIVWYATEHNSLSNPPVASQRVGASVGLNRVVWTENEVTASDATALSISYEPVGGECRLCFA